MFFIGRHHFSSALLPGVLSLLGANERHSFFIRHLPDSQIPILVLPLYHAQKLVGNLVLADPHSGKIDCEYLMELVADVLIERLAYSNVEQMRHSSFKSYLLDVFRGRLDTASENLQRLHELPYPIQQFMRPALLSFAASTKTVPYDYLREVIK